MIFLNRNEQTFIMTCSIRKNLVLFCKNSHLMQKKEMIIITVFVMILIVVSEQKLSIDIN